MATKDSKLRSRQLLPVSVGILISAGAACSQPIDEAAPEPGKKHASREIGQEGDTGETHIAARAPAVSPDGKAQAEIDDLRKALRAAAVVHERPVAEVFYSWTTPEQISELRDKPDGLLLSRAESPTQGRSRFDQALSAAGKKNAGVALLAKSDCGARRFAWTNPWSSHRGPGDEHYGDRLIRIQLRADSVIASFEASSGLWRYFDLSGTELSSVTASEAGDRIAAVYHVAEQPLPYREFVICNEAQIFEWSYANQETLASLDADSGLMKRVAKWLRTADKNDANELDVAIPESWKNEDASETVPTALAAALPWLDNPGGPENLADRLDRESAALHAAAQTMAADKPIARVVDADRVRATHSKRRAKDPSKSRKRRRRDRGPMSTFYPGGTY